MTTYTMVYRGVKGSPLTNTEVDTNFQNLDTYKSPLDSPSFTTLVNVTGQLTAVSATGALIASNGSGTGQTSIQLKRVGAATDQKMFELNSDSSGAFVIRAVNDAYSANTPILTAARGTGYTISTLTLLSAGGRVLVGSGSDDGVNALQVTGNIESDSKLVLSSTTAGLEIGSTTGTGTPTIDLHSSGTTADYDVRLSSTGGSSSLGNGVLNANAGGYSFQLAGTGYLSIVSGGRTIIGGGTDDGVAAFQVTNGNISIFNGIQNITRYGVSGAIRLRSAGGTSGSPTLIGTGVSIGQVLFTGYDGTTFQDTAQVLAVSEAAFTSSIAPTGLRFYTTGPATNVQSEAMRLTGSNRLLINQTSDDAIHSLQVTGGGILTSSGTIKGLVLTGPASTNSGLYLTNTTASTGRSFSVISGSGGNFSINDETAGSANRIVIMGGANRILLTGAADDASTNVQVGGTLKATSTITGTGHISNDYDANGANFRMTATGGNYGAFFRLDTTNMYLLLTASGSPNGTYNSLRPFSVTLSTGALSFDATGAGSTFGKRPTWAGATPWDNVNLPSPAQTNGSIYTALHLRTAGGVDTTWNWSGQGGQPGWVWGGNDGANMYVYNPSNFSVNYANSAGSVGGVTNPMSQSGGTFTGYVTSTSEINVPHFRVSNSYGAGGGLGLTSGGGTMSWNDNSGDGAVWIACNNAGAAGGIILRTVNASNTSEIGRFTISGSGIGTNGSDIRLKDNIETLEGSLDKIRAIRGVSYTYKASGEKHYGVIAQEVQPHFPDAVTTQTGTGGEDEDEYLGVAYTDLIAPLIESVKELADKLDAALKRIAELEGK